MGVTECVFCFPNGDNVLQLNGTRGCELGNTLIDVICPGFSRFVKFYSLVP